MVQMSDLEKADREVFTTSFDNGLVDIFLAGVLLMLIIAPILSVYIGDFWSSFIFLPFWGALFFALYWTRRNLIQPRVGVVKYGPRRKRKMTLFTGVMLALNLIFLIMGLLGFFMPVDSSIGVPITMSILSLISFSIAGFFLDISRYYLYGLMMAVAPPVGEWLYQNHQIPHHGFPVVFGFCALVIFLIGMIKLLSILRDNPLPNEDIP